MLPLCPVGCILARKKLCSDPAAQNWIILTSATMLTGDLAAMVEKDLQPLLRETAAGAAKEAEDASLELKPAAIEKMNKAAALNESTKELLAYLKDFHIPIRAALWFSNWRFYCHAGTLVDAVLKQQQKQQLRRPASAGATSTPADRGERAWAQAERL